MRTTAIKYQDRNQNEVLLATSDTLFPTHFLQKKRQVESSGFRSNHNVSPYNHPFTFTGKEKDAETGYSYFGARYYDSDLIGLFLSVDPMSDKYHSISPYAYCAWNPVKLVDPDGDSIVLSGTNEQKKKLSELIDQFKTRLPEQYKQLNNSSIKYNLQYSSDKGDGSGGSFTYDPTKGFFNVNISNDDSDFSDIEVLGHELKHAQQFEEGKLGFLLDLQTKEVTPLAYDLVDEIEAARQAELFSVYPRSNEQLERDVSSLYSSLPRNSQYVKSEFRKKYPIIPGQPIFTIEKYNEQHYIAQKGNIIIYNTVK